MPLTIGGVVYRHVLPSIVIDPTGDPQENLSGGLVYARNGGTALAIAEYPSGVPLPSVQSSVHGLTPDLYVAFPVGVEPEGFVDFPGDGIPAVPLTASAAEYTDWMRSFVVADVEAATSSAASAEQNAATAATTVAGFDTRLVAAEQSAALIGPAVTQAQLAADQAVTASNAVTTFEARVAALEAGGAGGTGVGEVFVVRTVNGVWDHPTLASAQAGGYVAGQFVIFAGTAAGPDWAPQYDSAFFRNAAHNRTV